MRETFATCLSEEYAVPSHVQQDGVLLPAVDRAPLQGPFASSPVFALMEGSLRSPIPGLLPFPKPAVELGEVLIPKFGTV